MEMKLFITILFVTCVTGGLQAQNLLYNGSFEECTGCPDHHGALKICAYWSIPNHSTPDIYKECDSLYFNNFDIPFNVGGHQEPFSGRSYAGMYLFYDEASIYPSEYLQGGLREELQANVLYKVTFYISWAEYSNYFCDRIGYLFSPNCIIPEPLTTKSQKQNKKQHQFEGRPSVNNLIPVSSGHILLDLDTLMDRESWHKIEFTYQAKGGEKYLILGLFGDNVTEEDYQHYASNVYAVELSNYGPANVGKVYRKLSDGGKAAYYYIDDISIERSSYTNY